MWLTSAATPGVLAISYSVSLETSGFSFMSRARGCPIPPAAPRTATLRWGTDSEEKPRAAVALARVLTDRRSEDLIFVGLGKMGIGQKE